MCYCRLCALKVCSGLWRSQVGLAFLQMLDLAGSVFSADVAAMETSNFQTLQKISGDMGDGVASRWR
jgi:hypothetical protein